MGNNTSHGCDHGSLATGKLILSDGSVQELNESITVAELMLEHPKRGVVELEQVVAQKREQLTPLLADKTLEANKFYVMVPFRKGKLAHMSPREARLILLRASALTPSSKVLPFLARIWPMSSNMEKYSNSRIAISTEVSSHEMKEDEEEDEDEDLEVIGRACYLKKKVCGKGWKPSLDTIEEKKCEGSEVYNWVELATKVGKRIEHKGLVWG